jgi:signal transduction histidine kinase/CheY-like chemotaxis protein
LLINLGLSLMAGALAGILAVLVFYLITQKLILSPVRELTRVAEHVAQGEHGVRSQIVTGDEYEELARAFNAMLSHLQSSENELRTINKSLDTRLSELAERNVALFESNKIKSQFLANVSHELRTPLTSIIGFAELLREASSTEGGRLLRYSENIMSSGRMLLGIINDLLDLAKIEAGQTTVRVSEFDARDLFSSLRGMFKPLLLNPAVKLVFEEPSGAMALHTDEAKVAQILRNLVSNALKFTERGEVLVRAACQTENRAVEFTVADTGIGIAPEHQARIFQEFGQVESPLQRKLRGTGLGLPLSRRLAELLGGTLTVESQLGVGSTFRAVIPLVYTARAVSVPGAEAADVTQFPVLVIEDDAQMQDIYQAFLRGSGFHCLPAFSLKEARQVLAHTRPLAFILDILLPGENGWEFLSELKSQPATCDVPVLVVTVLEDRQHALMLRAADFCTKPVKRAWLLRKLREIATTAPVSTVLIVDDEEASRYLLKGALANTKYKLLEARGGVEGLQLAREHCPDVIFLDLVMPDLTGFEVLVQLRQDEHTRDIPVIVVTSKVLEAEELALLRESTAAIIPKSITTRDAMLAQIRSTLARLAGQTEKPRTFS